MVLLGVEDQDTITVGSPQVHWRGLQSRSAVVLRWAARLWLFPTIAGQWVFTYYIIAAYWLGAGDLEKPVTDVGLAFLAHVGLAVAVFVGGPLQLSSRLRARYPSFHRWNGRAYAASVLIATASGLFMIWTKGTVGGLGVQLGTSFGAVLVTVFLYKTITCARLKQFDDHRRWALRLFIAAVAVWYFRIQIMLWFMLSGGWGIDAATFEGPALVALSFTQYLLPLLVLEMYFHAQKSNSGSIQVVSAATIVALTLASVAGTYAAIFGMWLPRM